MNNNQDLSILLSYFEEDTGIHMHINISYCLACVSSSIHMIASIYIPLNIIHSLNVAIVSKHHT
jgi:hypothetical protein